ncbi:hypothetical protein LINPERPRIM_LOCUS24604 [Linum perenne]
MASPSEDGAGLTGVDDSKNSSDKLGSFLKSCDSHEKTQFVKQRNNNSGRRGDRRPSKISTKARYDPFSSKAGLPTFNSAAGGTNFSAVYGLKTDVHDITKLVDELSLNDLLSGTYQCCRVGKEKVKKAGNSTESLLHSLTKACSVLQVPKPALSQNVAEIDSCSNENTVVCPQNSLSLSNGEDGETTVDLSSPDKMQDSCSKPDFSPHLLNFQFEQPKDTLERLALAPSKDLESLLQDAVKPAASSRSASDQRPGKQLARGASLPPFPWSQNFNGHCRTNSDTAKLVTSRSTCQGRWGRVDNWVSSIGVPSNCFANLESLIYDEALVPSCGPKLEGDNITAAGSTPACTCNCSLSTTQTSLTSQFSSGNDSSRDISVVVDITDAEEHCPRVLAAAQTLVDIAACSVRRLNHERITKWPKHPSQKAMKARKVKFIENHHLLTASTSFIPSNSIIRDSMDNVTPSKKPKLSTVETNKDSGYLNGNKHGRMPWPTPKSSTSSSPSKPLEGSITITESRHSAAFISKPPRIMPPPPAKVLGRTYGSQSKVRKLM